MQFIRRDAKYLRVSWLSDHSFASSSYSLGLGDCRRSPLLNILRTRLIYALEAQFASTACAGCSVEFPLLTGMMIWRQCVPPDWSDVAQKAGLTDYH